MFATRGHRIRQTTLQATDLRGFDASGCADTFNVELTWKNTFFGDADDGMVLQTKQMSHVARRFATVRNTWQQQPHTVSAVRQIAASLLAACDSRPATYTTAVIPEVTLLTYLV